MLNVSILHIFNVKWKKIWKVCFQNRAFLWMQKSFLDQLGKKASLSSRFVGFSTKQIYFSELTFFMNWLAKEFSRNSCAIVCSIQTVFRFLFQLFLRLIPMLQVNIKRNKPFYCSRITSMLSQNNLLHTRQFFTLIYSYFCFEMK